MSSLFRLAVNASILSQIRGICDQTSNFDSDACELKLSLITATAYSSALSTFFMGLVANLPIALAPGMGLLCSVNILYTHPLISLFFHFHIQTYAQYHSYL